MNKPRLIDANETIAEIKDWQQDIHDNEYDAEKYDFVFERIYEIIEEQSTAYDVEGVVEQLEKFLKSDNVHYITVNNAIKIVKGGANNG